MGDEIYHGHTAREVAELCSMLARDHDVSVSETQAIAVRAAECIDDQCDTIARLREALERAIDLLVDARPYVRAEIGEYEMFLQHNGKRAEAHAFGKKELARVKDVLDRVDRFLSGAEPRRREEGLG